MSTVLRVIISSLLLALAVPQASAQRQEGGVECATTKGAYRVHFTAYQAPKGLEGGAYLERYCEQIPLPGEILITLDIYRTYGAYIVRDQPVAVRVLEGAPGGKAGRVLLELPAKAYSSGIVEMRPNFARPGDYHVVIAVGEDPENTITIPLRVGMSSGLLAMDTMTRRLFILLLVTLAGLAAYSLYSRRKAPFKSKKGSE